MKRSRKEGSVRIVSPYDGSFAITLWRTSMSFDDHLLRVHVHARVRMWMRVELASAGAVGQ